MISKKDYIAKYGEEAWETERIKRSQYQKEYYNNNKAEKLVKLKEHRSTSEYHDWRRKYDKSRRGTKKGRANSLISAYKETDKKRGLGETTITSEWIIDNIFTSSCIYCGDNNWKHLGTDRIDNSKAHTPDNCICACAVCNAERADRFTVSEFIEYKKHQKNF